MSNVKKRRHHARVTARMLRYLPETGTLNGEPVTFHPHRTSFDLDGKSWRVVSVQRRFDGVVKLRAADRTAGPLNSFILD